MKIMYGNIQVYKIKKFKMVAVVTMHNVDVFFCFSKDLPVQLILPEAILSATSHQDLTSLAMLGQGQQHSVKEKQRNAIDS